MARYRNKDWDLNNDINAEGNAYGLTRRCVAVLMDIRDEMQTLNRLLGCHNFTNIPRTLIGIQRNTARPKPKRQMARKA